jgi:hypothetical protein
MRLKCLLAGLSGLPICVLAAAPPQPTCVADVGALPQWAFAADKPGKDGRELNGKPLKFASDASCLNLGDGKQTGALLVRLGNASKTGNVKVTVYTVKEQTLPAKVDVLDVGFKPLKSYSFDRFTQRGMNYSHTVFADPAGNAAFILISPDVDWLGRTHQTTSGERWWTYVPGLVGGFANGNETQHTASFASGGELKIELEEDSRSTEKPRR